MKTNLAYLIVFGMLSVACQQGKQFSLPPVTDQFGQNVLYNNKIDVVIMVDNSSSMNVHQSNLRTAVPAMVQSLLNLKMDLHMGVITSSMCASKFTGGKLIGSPAYLTNTSPNVAQALADRMLVGNAGCDNTEGLGSLSAMLSPSYLNGAGAGFLRSDAYLVVIGMSDEEDASAGTSAQYISFLNQLKPAFSDGKQAWIANFIGIPNPIPAACSDGFTYVEPSLRWMDMLNSSKGQFASVCSNDLSSAVSNIKARIIQVLTDYVLKKVPRLDSIVVRINGVLIPKSTVNGWDYISDINAIRFYGSAVPAADGVVVVDFVPAQAN